MRCEPGHLVDQRAVDRARGLGIGSRRVSVDPAGDDRLRDVDVPDTPAVHRHGRAHSGRHPGTPGQPRTGVDAAGVCAGDDRRVADRRTRVDVRDRAAPRDGGSGNLRVPLTETAESNLGARTGRDDGDSVHDRRCELVRRRAPGRCLSELEASPVPPGVVVLRGVVVGGAEQRHGAGAHRPGGDDQRHRREHQRPSGQRGQHGCEGTRRPPSGRWTTVTRRRAVRAGRRRRPVRTRGGAGSPRG